MPEGPEVKILTSYLNDLLKGKKLSKVKFKKGRYVKHGPPKTILSLSLTVV